VARPSLPGGRGCWLAKSPEPGDGRLTLMAGSFGRIRSASYGGPREPPGQPDLTVGTRRIP
jgi:hypothetical protein